MARSHVRDSRHISLARALHARLYVNCEGRIFAVGGQAAHGPLAQVLARHRRCPTAAEAPTPRDLGLLTCDGELTDPLLHSMSCALNRWRKQLAAEAHRRPARRRRTINLLQEHCEVERLAARLAAVRQWRAQLEDGDEPTGAPFFLDPDAERPLQAELQVAERVHPLSPLIAWQARVICWLSGECAMRRFLAATTSLLTVYPEVSYCDQVRRFQRAAVTWKRRSRRENICNLRAEIAQHLKRLPSEVVREGKLSSRLRGRTFREHCSVLFERCSQLLTKQQLHRWQVLPAALAALTAVDNSAVPIPQRCFRPRREQENFPRIERNIAELAQQIGQPGYDALLAAIDQLPESEHEFDYGEVRAFLGAGNSLADTIWACEQEMTYCLKDSCLSIPEVRRLGAAFAKRGCPLSIDDLACVVRSIRRKEDLVPINAWLAWLGSASPRTFTPRMQRVLHTALFGRFLPSVGRRGWFKRLAPCLAPVHLSKSRTDCTPLLQRVTDYQQAIGRGATMPKSLRKLLESCQRRQREREHLRSCVANNSLDDAARLRFSYLENDAGASLNLSKLRRAAEETFLLLGVQAQAAVTHRLAEAMCEEHLADLVPAITRDQFWDFALWLDKMTEAERNRLHALIAAHRCYGREYKRYLSANQGWLSKAAVRGIDLRPWFAADSHFATSAGGAVEIAVASELHKIFLMGTYFRTCLSLGGCNEMSVLANAYDANKQVIFMSIEDDTGRTCVVARQLIAISSEFKMVRYNCYVSDHLKFEKTQDMISSYCGRLAAECGLELADQGTPDQIADHFWYDDGEGNWPAAARSAWDEHSQEEHRLAVTC